MEYIEVSAKTVSDCITEACQKLGVTSDKLEYEVLEEGSTGFLGIGAKPAKIKACVKCSIEDNAKNFLKEGNKVKAVVRFKGREMSHMELGREVLQKFQDACAEFGAAEKGAVLEGRYMSVVISPLKASSKSGN